MNVVFALWAAVALVCCSLEFFRILQICSYMPQRGYFHCFFTPSYLILIFVAAFSAVWQLYIRIDAVLCSVYTLACIPFFFAQHKTQLKLTKRLWRMLVVDFALLFVGCMFYLHCWSLFLPFTVVLSWLFCLPVDMLVSRYYLKKASCKLKQSSIKVIAITGSFGKTSTKSMLASLLCNSQSPQGSCNTPLGIASYINKTPLNKEYLILEFGARKRGDIEKLCKLYPPQFGIITGVCEQHLATFGSIENIIAEKGRLAVNLPECGFCLLAKNCEVFENTGKCEKISVRVSTENCVVSPHGITFDAIFNGQRFPVHLPQITTYSAETFALCATMCDKLGQSTDVTLSNSCNAVQTPHRMEISHNGRFFIIDDSYNASEKGIEGCCETLALLKGRKIVVSQGIVECGKMRDVANVRCGKKLGDVCDVFVAVGKNSAKLLEGAGQSACTVLLQEKSLRHAVEAVSKYLQKDCFLLFQNDLPDAVSLR